jgi:hypothetical protein
MYILILVISWIWVGDTHVPQYHTERVQIVQNTRPDRVTRGH